MALLCLLLMAAFYLAVIIGQPQEDETASTVTPRTDQPLPVVERPQANGLKLVSN